MNRECLIFGASKLGKSAYMILEESYNIIGFLDNDKSKSGTLLFNLPVYLPSKLDLSKYHIVIASVYEDEILEQIQSLGCTSYEIYKYNLGLPKLVSFSNLELKKISIGKLLYETKQENVLSNITFLNNGSGILDYLLLKCLAKVTSANNYLEIGTFTGESILAVSELDSIKECYSVSLPDKSLDRYFEVTYGKENFSRYFSRNQSKITHFEGDSKEFDYSLIPIPDLVFIDGDHSFEGIAIDTKNIFEKVGYENTIVVWHDYLDASNKLNLSTHQAINSVLHEDYMKNIYLVNNTMCGVYIPQKYSYLTKYKEENNELYSYEISLHAKRNIRN